MKAIIATALLLGLSTAQANENELLVKFKSNSSTQSVKLLNQLPAGTQVEKLGLGFGSWI